MLLEYLHDNKEKHVTIRGEILIFLSGKSLYVSVDKLMLKYEDEMPKIMVPFFSKKPVNLLFGDQSFSIRKHQTECTANWWNARKSAAISISYLFST